MSSVSSIQSKQFAKPTAQVNSELNAKKCSDCKEVEKQLATSSRQADKVKKFNDKLRHELRDISKQLDETLEKVKAKKMEKQSQDPKRRIEVLQEELKNATKNLKVYKKQYTKLNTKMEGGYDVEKITAMLRVVQNREHELNEVKVENKTLLKLKRDSDRVLSKRNDDRILNGLRDEILMTKNLILDAKKTERINEKNFKKQQEYITKLDIKHREVCEVVGADYEVNAPTKQELFPTQIKNKSTLTLPDVSKKSRSKSRKPLYEPTENFDGEVDESQMELTWDKFKQFKDKIDILKRNLKSNGDIHQKKEKQLLNKQIKVEQEIHQLTALIEEKERDLQNSIERMKELQSIIDQNGTASSQGYYYVRSADLRQILKKGKEIRIEQGGVKVSSELAHSFQDSSHLPGSKDYNISEVKVTYEDEYILSLEVEYKLKNGEKEVVTCFKNRSEPKKPQKATLTLKGTEYIQQIQGFYNKGHIEYLKIISSRGNYLMAGQERNITKCQSFTLDIQKSEKPISFFGTVDKLPKLKKNKGRDDEYCLVALGVELRKKDAFSVKQAYKSQHQSRQEIEYDEEEVSENNPEVTKNSEPMLQTEAEENSAAYQQQEEQEQEVDDEKKKNKQKEKQQQEVKSKNEKDLNRKASIKQIEKDDNSKQQQPSKKGDEKQQQPSKRVDSEANDKIAKK